MYTISVQSRQFFLIFGRHLIQYTRFKKINLIEAFYENYTIVNHLLFEPTCTCCICRKQKLSSRVSTIMGHTMLIQKGLCTCPLSVLYSDNDKINYSTNYNNSNRYKELSCVIGRTFKVFCRTYELSPVIGQNFKVFCRIYELFPVTGHTFKAFYRIFELSRTIGQLNFQGILQNL